MSRQSIKQELRHMVAPRCRFGESKHEVQTSDNIKTHTNPNLDKFTLDERKYFFLKTHINSILMVL